MNDLLDLEYFRRRVGESFDLLLDDGSRYPLTLQRADALTPHAYPGRLRDPFELHFVGTADILQQRTWTLENAAIGSLDIFLVPVRNEDGRAVYQAIFT